MPTMSRSLLTLVPTYDVAVYSVLNDFGKDGSAYREPASNLRVRM
jgi:hypothetical protein